MLAAQATGAQQEIPNYFFSYKEKNLNYFHVKCYTCHMTSNRDANTKLISILLAFHDNYLAVVLTFSEKSILPLTLRATVGEDQKQKGAVVLC